MRSIGSLQTELEATGISDLAVLLDIKFPTPIYRTQRVVDSGWDGTFGGNTYIHDAFEFSEINQDVEGTRPAFTITMQNAVDASGNAVPWSTHINANENELNGYEVIIRLAKLSLLVAGDEDSVLTEQKWFVDGGSLEGTTMKLRCAPPTDALAQEAPVFSQVSDTCGLKYKEPAGGCTSVSTEEFCDKLFPS